MLDQNYTQVQHELTACIQDLTHTFYGEAPTSQQINEVTISQLASCAKEVITSNLIMTSVQTRSELTLTVLEMLKLAQSDL